jgi:cation:H+ antiporter
MILDITILAASLLLILFCCVIFVNAIELLGKTLNLHQGIVGSILAAVGTALPETIIPIIAILFSPGKEAHNVGIGAIAGAPFMLGTLAFFVTGAAIIIYSFMGKRTVKMNAGIHGLERDLSFFLIYYGAAVVTTFFHEIFVLKAIVALALIASYPIYLRWTIKSESAEIEDAGNLYLSRYFRLPATLPFIVLQLTISLVLLVAGAHYFVAYVQALSASIGVPALILSLIITPIATELPEKLNSIIWVGKSKDTLALGNITGAMVFQSCFPIVFGMLFTDWHLQGATLVSAACALSSGLLMLGWVRIKKSINPYLLCCGGIFYGILIFYIAFFGK